MAAFRGGSQNQIVIIRLRLDSSCSETIALAGQAGQILLVAAKGQTKRLDIDEGLGILHRQAGPIDESRVVIVLNKTDTVSIACSIFKALAARGRRT